LLEIFYLLFCHQKNPHDPLIHSLALFHFSFFFLYMFFGKPAVHFRNFLLSREVSPQLSAIPGGNPPGDWQSAVDWGDARFELWAAGQKSGTLPLSHHASY
jgi:hypothetical protein